MDKDVLERAVAAARTRLGPANSAARVGELLQPIINRFSGSQAIGAMVEQYLAQAMPPELKGRWRVSGLAGGCLYIQAEDSSCAYELRLLTNELLDGLRCHSGLKKLREIKITRFRRI